MTAQSILNMHLTQEFRRRQEEKLLRGIALKQAITGLIVEGRELWGAEWPAWFDQFNDDHAGKDTWGEFYDALVLEIERRKAPPVDDAHEAWIAAMYDVDKLADEHSPDTAAAMKIEEAAHQVYLNGLPANSISAPEALTENTP